MGISGVWRTRGFEAFSRGVLGNGGQNLYVSRAGVLQRIHYYDINQDGYVDLAFCNSQNHWETPPSYAYSDSLGAAGLTELPNDGARAGVVADLNGDGYEDLVIACYYSGARYDVNSSIYYGSPDGWSERRRQLLPTPRSTSVAAGDFNGDGRPDLAFLCDSKVRIFYQTDFGFEPAQYTDLPIEGEQLAAGDLDGDGCAELIVRQKDGSVRVYWGAPAGPDPTQCTLLPVEPDPAPPASDAPAGFLTYAESMEDSGALVKVVALAGVPHVFVARQDAAYLVPLHGRRCGEPLRLACRRPLSIAAADLDGDGYDDIVLACRQPAGDAECSWVFWGGPAGFEDSRRTPLPSNRACDVALGDLDGDGRPEVVLCQHHDAELYTTHSLIYRVGRQGPIGEPRRLVTHDARRAFVAAPAGPGKLHVAFINQHARSRLGNMPVNIYLGGPDGYTAERKLSVAGWGAVEYLMCDVNDDGWPDLILANASENSVWRDPGSYVFINGPAGLPAQPTWKLPTTRAMSVACADIDRDGYLELIFAGFDNPDLLIFHRRPDGDGYDAEHPQRIRVEYAGHTYRELRLLHLADLNNDGWLDLVVPEIVSDRSFVLWGGPQGFSMERCQPLAVRHACCARSADLTGNGYLDLLIGGHQPSVAGPHDSWVYIYWNGPDGLREDRRQLLPADAVNGMTLADFNNDGRLDLFVGSYHGALARDIDSYIYWNRAGRGFSAEDRLRLFTHSASGNVAADFNEDGWIDLAIGYHKVEGDHAGYSAVWWNGPAGFDPGRVTRLPTFGPHGMNSVDVGNNLDRGPEEYYISEPHELPAPVELLVVRWEGDVPPKTWVRAQVRLAETRQGLQDAPWLGAGGPNTWLEHGQPLGAPAGRWLQYRLALGATNGVSTPRLRSVDVAFV